MKQHKYLEFKYSEFQSHKNDKASAPVQCAVVNDLIFELQHELRESDHNKEVRLKLIYAVCKRRKLLNYIKSTDLNKYRWIVKRLDIHED